jgi:pilus assembly protein CpaD
MLMSDTQQTQISTLPKLALAAVLAFGVASCGTGSFTEQISNRSGFMDPPPQNEITVTPYAHAVDLAAGQNRLNGNQNATLSSFLAQVGRDRGDHYEIRTAFTSGDPVQSERNNKIARDLKKSFIAQGVNADRIQLVNIGEYSSKLELVVRRYTVISPACGIVDVNLSSGFDDEPLRDRSLGCSNEYNLGKMLADPRDLVGGRKLDPATAEREVVGQRRYGTGVVEAPGENDTSTTGN